MAVESSCAGPVAGVKNCRHIATPKKGVGNGHVSRSTRGGRNPRFPQRCSDARSEGMGRDARERSIEGTKNIVVVDPLERACSEKFLQRRDGAARKIVVDEALDDDRGAEMSLSIRLTQGGRDETHILFVKRHEARRTSQRRQLRRALRRSHRQEENRLPLKATKSMESSKKRRR